MAVSVNASRSPTTKSPPTSRTRCARRVLRPGDAGLGDSGASATTSPSRASQAAITGKTPDGEPTSRRLQVHRRIPDGRRLRGERRVLHADLRNAGRRQPQHRLRAHRAAAVDARGQRGARASTDCPTAGWDVADTYGLLVDLDKATAFCKAVAKAEGLRIAYIVTDDERRFQAVARRLPEGSSRSGSMSPTSPISALRTGSDA